MRALSVLTAMEMLKASSETHLSCSPYSEEIGCYGYAHNVQHFVLTWGRLFHPLLLENELFIPTDDKNRPSIHQQHFHLVGKKKNLFYAEGFRFDEITGEMTFTSWCVSSEMEAIAIDCSVADKSARHIYFGMMLETSFVSKTIKAEPEVEKEGILPMIISNKKPLPEAGLIIHEF
jgi:hypothetical protein